MHHVKSFPLEMHDTSTCNHLTPAMARVFRICTTRAQPNTHDEYALLDTEILFFPRHRGMVPAVAFRCPTGTDKRYENFAMPARLGTCRCIRIRGRSRNDAGAQKNHVGLSAKCHLPFFIPSKKTGLDLTPARVRALHANAACWHRHLRQTPASPGPT